MKILVLNERKVSIIINVVDSFDIEFDVFFIDGEALLLYSCFCFIIGQHAFISYGHTLKVANKRKCQSCILQLYTCKDFL